MNAIHIVISKGMTEIIVQQKVITNLKEL